MTPLAKMWRKATGQGVIEKKVFRLPIQESRTSIFRKQYDLVQSQLQAISGMVDLLSGTAI